MDIILEGNRRLQGKTSGERGGQRPLERTRSSKNSVKTSIPSRDKNVHFIGLLSKTVSSPATFVSTISALPYRFLSANDPVSWNRCTKRVFVDAFSPVSAGYFC
ncbi:hypothetical protein TNCV_4760391 [Trichonephila clavipes]|uniref:Uncharacterized protein n=1 Tax=Trichonephila clavipes TaxID=2585209 RepID=A0A8X6RFJ3_TRICX|nr:hypothetical protein TNCV_4760391 [Trichonephila clavipes]